jgi:hypothetical protein
MKSPVKLPKGYQNNPFFVATDGLELLFKRAKSVAIAFAVLCVLSVLSSLPNYMFSAPPTSAPTPQAPTASASPQLNFEPTLFFSIGAIVLAVVLILIFIGIVYSGVSDYTSSKIARGKTTDLKEALRALFANFKSYTWLLVVIAVKVMLWSLLFIIPGIIMAFRYSLAGVSFFDKGLKGSAATKHSAAITKDALLTTMASHTLLNLITFGAIQPLVTSGTNAVLYKQFVDLKEKPKPHILSWLTLIIPILLTLFIVIAVLSLVYAFSNYQSVAP